MHSLTNKFSVLLCIISFFASAAVAQDDANRWLRILTDDDSIIEVDRTSLALGPEQVIRASFNIKYTKPEPLAGSAIRYQVRQDAIQFRLDRKQYRIVESNFLDLTGHTLSSTSSAGHDDWKIISGRTASALFSAATQLYPFGVWKVISYRYASGEKPSGDEPAALTAFVGSQIYLGYNRVEIGNRRCESPVLDPGAMTTAEFSRKVGSSLESLAMPDSVNTLYLRCSSKVELLRSEQRPTLKRRQKGSSDVEPRSDSGKEVEYTVTIPPDFPSTTLILRQPDKKILMLWDGVFFELERPPNIFRPEAY